MFPLKFGDKNYFRVYTRRTSSDNGKVAIRFLNIEKNDPNLDFLIKDSSPTNASITENFRPIKYYIEIWHKDVNGALTPAMIENRDTRTHKNRALIRYPNEKTAPLLRRSVQDILVDPLQIPKDMGAAFFLKVLAIGKPRKKRRVTFNIKFKVECRGYYPQAVETDTALNTRINAGEFKVLANGKID